MEEGDLKEPLMLNQSIDNSNSERRVSVQVDSLEELNAGTGNIHNQI
jgi:hypothetical protein